MVTITLERGRDDIEPVILGPFDWVQVTYDTVRIPPDGETILMFSEGDWYPIKESKINNYWSKIQADTSSEEYWSDLIIGAVK